MNFVPCKSSNTVAPGRLLYGSLGRTIANLIIVLLHPSKSVVSLVWIVWRVAGIEKNASVQQ